jgi:uncharacterized membrane protein
MKTENKEFMERARKDLSGKWPLAVGTFFVFTLINSIGGRTLIDLIIGGSMQLGVAIFSLNLIRGKKAEFAQIFDGFKYFAESLIAYLLLLLFVLLWSLLLIVPGIIAALGYSQTFFIMADNKTIKGAEALRQSKKMMDGYKWKFFCLGLRFFGWFLLSILTFGIGFLWLIPYATISFANFYEELKKHGQTKTQR